MLLNFDLCAFDTFKKNITLLFLVKCLELLNFVFYFVYFLIFFLNSMDILKYQ